MELALFGEALLGAMVDKNGIRRPKLNLITDTDSQEFKNIKAFATCGYYRTDEIKVAPALCAYSNSMYSWPGFISDRTPYGVVMHEFGHHVDEVHSGFNIYRRTGSKLSDKIKQKSGEKAITSYAPHDPMEWFAEIFRLFCTNPDLLRQIRPKAYQAILDEGIQPVVINIAESVLNIFNAPQRVYERMNKHIKEAK